jgi:hypothetical protein
MNRRHLLALPSLALLPITPARAELDAQALLQASDAIRTPRESFRLTSTLHEYRQGVLQSTLQLTVFVRPDRQGRHGNLVRFDQPARDANKLMLFQGADLWFYDPVARVSFRLSPQQRLLGQAANGDVAMASLAQDYSAQLEGVESVMDGDRVAQTAHRLRLTARHAQTTYAAIDFWQASDDARPLKARFYSDSGQLMKSAFYRRNLPWLGRVRPTELVIIDGLNPQWVTLMRYSDFVAQDVPEAWMQRDFLPRFRQ